MSEKRPMTPIEQAMVVFCAQAAAILVPAIDAAMVAVQQLYDWQTRTYQAAGSPYGEGDEAMFRWFADWAEAIDKATPSSRP